MKYTNQPCKLPFLHVYYHMIIVKNQCCLWHIREQRLEGNRLLIPLFWSLHLFSLISDWLFSKLVLYILIFLSTSHKNSHSRYENSLNGNYYNTFSSEKHIFWSPFYSIVLLIDDISCLWRQASWTFVVH